jgi:AcrR family transcriptional regulator
MTDEMERAADKSMRRPRSDAERNRLRLLEAAKAVFSAGGPDASLEAVAREAGLGIGTLYRHFPNREALFEAVYRREVDELVALAGRLAAHEDPLEALRDWLRANVAFVATKRGMAAALAVAASKPSELTAYSTARLTEALAGLLGRAEETGAVRADVAAPDLLKALIGMCLIHDGPGWQDGVLRMIDVLVAGLAARVSR